MYYILKKQDTFGDADGDNDNNENLSEWVLIIMMMIMMVATMTTVMMMAAMMMIMKMGNLSERVGEGCRATHSLDKFPV